MAGTILLLRKESHKEGRSVSCARNRGRGKTLLLRRKSQKRGVSSPVKIIAEEGTSLFGDRKAEYG